MREVQKKFLPSPKRGYNLSCKYKTFNFLDIRHKSQKYKILERYAINVQSTCNYFFISHLNKTSKKHVSKKSIFCHIVILVFKLEIVKDIFENEKLNLNLNSMRFKKKTKIQKIIETCKSFCCAKKVGVQL